MNAATNQPPILTLRLGQSDQAGQQSGDLIGGQIVDTGGGYISQNMQPVHFGLGRARIVDVEIVSMSKSGRKTIKLQGVAANQTVMIAVQR